MTKIASYISLVRFDQVSTNTKYYAFASEGENLIEVLHQFDFTCCLAAYFSGGKTQGFRDYRCLTPLHSVDHVYRFFSQREMFVWRGYRQINIDFLAYGL